MGGFTHSWRVAQRIQGVLAPQSGTETVTRGGVEVAITYRFYFDIPMNIVPVEMDRFVSQDMVHTYEILFVNRPMNTRNFLIADMREVEKPMVANPNSGF